MAHYYLDETGADLLKTVCQPWEGVLSPPPPAAALSSVSHSELLGAGTAYIPAETNPSALCPLGGFDKSAEMMTPLCTAGPLFTNGILESTGPMEPFFNRSHQ